MKKYNYMRFGFIGFVVFCILAFAANFFWNHQQKDGDDFLKKLNLLLTLKVIEIKPTGDHGYGVIFGKVMHSNKPPAFTAVQKDEYLFCKISDGKVLMVTDYYVFQKDDSVIVDSRQSKYWIYRTGKLVSEYNLTTTTDDFLYGHLKEGRYLDFKTYEK